MQHARGGRGPRGRGRGGRPPPVNRGIAQAPQADAGWHAPPLPQPWQPGPAPGGLPFPQLGFAALGPPLPVTLQQLPMPDLSSFPPFQAGLDGGMGWQLGPQPGWRAAPPSNRGRGGPAGPRHQLAPGRGGWQAQGQQGRGRGGRWAQQQLPQQQQQQPQQPQGNGAQGSRHPAPAPEGEQPPAKRLKPSKLRKQQAALDAPPKPYRALTPAEAAEGARWQEERRKHFPSAANVQAKQAAAQQAADSGAGGAEAQAGRRQRLAEVLQLQQRMGLARAAGTEGMLLAAGGGGGGGGRGFNGRFSGPGRGRGGRFARGRQAQGRGRGRGWQQQQQQQQFHSAPPEGALLASAQEQAQASPSEAAAAAAAAGQEAAEAAAAGPGDALGLSLYRSESEGDLSDYGAGEPLELLPQAQLAADEPQQPQQVAAAETAVQEGQPPGTAQQEEREQQQPEVEQQQPEAEHQQAECFGADADAPTEQPIQRREPPELAAAEAAQAAAAAQRQQAAAARAAQPQANGGGPQQQQQQRQPRPAEPFVVPKRPPALLERLLAGEVRQEHSYLLQCLRFLAANAFLQAPGAPLRFPAAEGRPDPLAELRAAAPGSDGDASGGE